MNAQAVVIWRVPLQRLQRNQSLPLASSYLDCNIGVQEDHKVNDSVNTWWSDGPTRFPRRLVACALALACWASACLAADPRTDATNKGAVELETGGSAGISVRIAEDLAGLVDDGATRRVLPVVGRTATQNLWDLLLLRGIDMAILQTDVLDSVRQQHSLPGVEGSFTYITKLYNEEFHLLAAPEVKTIADLVHRRVNVGLRDSGSDVTAKRLFDLLKIPVEPVYDRPEAALDKLRHGDIVAMAFVAGKPATLFQNVQQEDHLHFVAIPLEADVINAYVPTALSAQDYPGLIPKDQPVDTVAVGSLLAVAKLQPGSERYRNVSNFVDVFFTQFRTLLEPGHHPKWRETNLAAELSGWTRFPPAQQWLDRNAAVAKQNPQEVKTLFSRFLDTRQQVLHGPPITDQQRQELFNQFQHWQAEQVH
jgi:TRAP-type uncharacterized transport system substrate-binding protein